MELLQWLSVYVKRHPFASALVFGWMLSVIWIISLVATAFLLSQGPLGIALWISYFVLSDIAVMVPYAIAFRLTREFRR